MKNLSFLWVKAHVYYLFFTIIYLSCATAQAHNYFVPLFATQQQTNITGAVSYDGMPMTGVLIKVKGKSTTTLSGDNGAYSIAADPSDILIFSYTGFKTIELSIDGKTTVNAFMQDNVTDLQEVTVNAGYYSVKEKERTGSIAKIKASDIEKQPVSNPLAAMQGRMAGVNITQASGIPGGGFNIQIRGINSIRGEGNDPLYIVDGVPYASQSLGNNDVSGNSFAGLSSPLSNINPADIENIEVLKDADATAIYGSRGANGVVLITTKKGKQGKTKFDLKAYTTVGTVTQKANLLNTQQYLAMRREAFSNDAIIEYPENAYDINGTWDQSRDTDWQKELIGGTAYINNVQASVSGGSAATQFLVSGTYRRETTVFPGESHYGRGTFHSSINHKSEDEKFSLMFAADYAGDKNTLPGTDFTAAAITLAPNAPALYDSTGNLNWENGTFQNPLGNLVSKYLNNTNNLIANTLLSYKFLPGFELKASLGYNDLRLSESRTRPSTMFSPFMDFTSADSQVFKNEGKRSSWIAEPQLSWQKKWGEAEFNVLAGATFQSQKQKSFAVQGAGFASNSLINSINAARTITILRDDVTEYNYNAFFGRVNINFKERYLLNLTGRRDGSSRFGPENRFANFGALGAAWIFSNEALLKNNVLSFGKLRTSYGITGNDQIGDYHYLDTYMVSTNIYDGITGIQPSRLFNPDFGWETNKKLEVAMDLGFLNDRIFLTAAYFKNRSSNQLVGIPLPGTTGFASLQANLDATVQNKGWEFEWRSVNLKTKNLNWSTSANITIPKNELMEFPGLEGSTYENIYVIGESLNVQQLYHYTGIDPETGLYTFEDINNDGQYNADDRKSIKDTSPKYYGGLSNALAYKNWNFDFLFQFVKQEALSIISRFPVAGNFSNQPVQVLNHFPQDNNPSSLQQYATGDNFYATQAQDRYLRSDASITDASFIRLKNVSLSYGIPTTWSKTFTGKIYVQGQNLLTFTKYKGADPENQSPFFLPPLKQFTLGVQLTF